MSAKLTGGFSKLRGEDCWGMSVPIAGDTQPVPGAEVLLTTRNGVESTEKIGRVVWRGKNKFTGLETCLCTIEGKDPDPDGNCIERGPKQVNVQDVPERPVRKKKKKRWPSKGPRWQQRANTRDNNEVGF